MYPFVRLFKDGLLARRAGPLDVLGTHVSHHICWPWDLDMWAELNNGRTLTIFDLGRIPLAIRTGLVAVMKRERWGLAIAGTAVRYRRRVRAFDRVVMRSRLIAWDRRFMYIEQAMFRPDGECTGHAVFRSAVTDAKGIVAPERVCAALGIDAASPPLPGWVEAWLAAEDQRPWPPMQEVADTRTGLAAQ
ncbi:acyl-CoA thioesterase [Citreimonas sp.]|uniref:acyl-CoA thioesterase n=1 Tax=Citreimonas sp. TaxID=3036715 RepID=UPI0035C7D951